MNPKTVPTTNQLALALVSKTLYGLRCSLRSFSYLDHTDIVVAREAISICEQRRGAKTKATLLRRKLKKMEKQYNAAMQAVKS
jgi:hypothetical protein